MRTNIKKIIYIFIFIIPVGVSCKKDKPDRIPNVYVNIPIDLFDPEFNTLSIPGNYIYITGGVKGIIIYRLTDQEFVAIDRCSSYQPENCCQVEVAENNLIIEDPCSDSQFSIIDGGVMKGPAELGLKTYKTSYDGYRYLNIYN